MIGLRLRLMAAAIYEEYDRLAWLADEWLMRNEGRWIDDDEAPMLGVLLCAAFAIVTIGGLLALMIYGGAE